MPTLFDHVAIVETAQPDKLEHLLAAGLRRYVVRPLGQTAVQVDHQHLAEVHKLLKRLGETPRVTAE